MAGNPRIVAADTTFRWDRAEQRLRRGTILDVPADSALERAIGRDNLVPLRPAESPQEAPEPPGETATQPAPRSRRGSAQDAAEDKSSDGKETGS